MANKRVAIVGAGPSGLVSARHALRYGLEPTVFEQANQIGGVWRGQEANGLAWPKMMTNVSCYGMRFLDFTLDPPNNRLHYTQEEMQDYLHGYAKHFGLYEHIRLGHKVTRVWQTGAEKWKVTSQIDGKTVEEDYDFVIVAGGSEARAFTPQFLNLDKFTGTKFHTAQFNNLNLEEEFGGKHVLVVGGSVTSCELLPEVVKHAAHVTHVMRKSSYILPRIVPTPWKNKRPADLVFFTRNSRKPGAEHKFSKAEDNMKAHADLKIMCAEQMEHPELRETGSDLDPPYLVVSDVYLDTVMRNEATKTKVTLIVGDPIREFESHGCVMESGARVKFDSILFCTGYSINLDFFDESIRSLVELDETDNHLQLILYKSTFRPELPSVAFVGTFRTAFFIPMELQARWATAVFAEKVALPKVGTTEFERVETSLDEERQIRTRKPRKRLAHDDWVGLADSIADEIGMLPDFEEMKVNDSSLYEAMWNAAVLPEHYVLLDPTYDVQAAKNVIKGCYDYSIAQD